MAVQLRHMRDTVYAVVASHIDCVAVTQVLDEADRMLSIGWAEQLATIRGHVQQGGARPQTLLFSATFPPAVDSAAAAWLHDPVRFTVTGTAATIGKELTQTVHLCSTHKKPRKLLRFIAKLKEEDKKHGVRQRSRILVFVNKIKTAKFVLALLDRHLNGVRGPPSGTAAGGADEGGGRGSRGGRGRGRGRGRVRGRGRGGLGGGGGAVKPRVRVDMLHGKLAQPLRQRILADFKGTALRVARVYR